MSGGGGVVSVVNGTPGGDQLFPATGDIVWAGGGADTVTGSGVEIHGGDGADRLVGDRNAAESLYGDAGNDTLNPSAAGGGDVLDGGAGDDVIYAAINDLQVSGGDGADRISVSAGSGQAARLGLVDGGTGDDTLYVRAYAGHRMVVDGGAGADYASVTVWDSEHPTDRATVYLNQSVAGDVTVIVNAEDVYVSAQVLTEYGSAGADKLWFGADSYEIRAGDGADTIVQADWSGQVSVNGGAIYGGAGADSIIAFGGDVVIRGEDGDDVVDGGLDHDDINGNAGADTLHGWSGNDWIVGGKDNDLVSGNTGDDIVYGNLGNDTCLGGSGADVVRGGQGDDSLSGGSGDDWMSGDRGADTLSGGAGADTFNFVAGAGLDRVLDFRIDQGDRVHIEGTAKYTVAQVGGDTVVDLSGGDTLVLVGVSASSLPAGWITGS